MPALDTIKAIIEALRQKQDNSPHVIDWGPGYPRRGVNMHSGLLGRTQKQVQYGQYQKVQSGIGEEPVSYEDWMKGQ